jgi:hypothetical protein
MLGLRGGYNRGTLTSRRRGATVGRLRKTTLIHVFAVCWVFSCGPLGAEDLCSLTVRVLSPDGRRPEAPVSVIEKSGRVSELEQGDRECPIDRRK